MEPDPTPTPAAGARWWAHWRRRARPCPSGACRHGTTGPAEPATSASSRTRRDAALTRDKRDCPSTSAAAASARQLGQTFDESREL